MKGSQENQQSKCMMEKGTFKFDLTLHRHSHDSVLFLLITNMLTGQQFTLKIDSFDIQKDRQLFNVFRTGEDVYRELLGDFEAIRIEEIAEGINLSLEVKLGKFRTEQVVLFVGRKTGGDAQPEGWEDSMTQTTKKKILVDPAFANKDYANFKGECLRAADAMLDNEVASQFSSEKRVSKNSLKNAFIMISNAILRNYKRHVKSIENDEDMKDYQQYKPVSKLLIQQNELLHNILMNAAEKASSLQVPDLGLDIHAEVPKEIIVVDSEGLEIPLREYLPKDNPEDFQSKIDYYEKRSRQLKAIKDKCRGIQNMELNKCNDFIHEKTSRLRMGQFIQREKKEAAKLHYDQFQF